MKITNGWRLFAPVAVLVSMTAGCGGGGGDQAGGGSSSGAGSPALAGTFLDNPVSGLGYSSGNLSGITDQRGSFNYVSGQPVTFRIGGISLGAATGGSTLSPVDLVTAAYDETDPTVTNIAAFLQTIDQDGLAYNGITIPSAVANAAQGMSVNFAQTTDAFAADPNVQSDIATLTKAGGNQRTLVSAGLAQNYLHAVLLRNLGLAKAGTYTGTIHSYCPSFDYNDPITITVTDSGMVSLPFSSQGQLSSGRLLGTGSIARASITVQSQSRGTVMIPYTGGVSGESLSLTGTSGDITSTISASLSSGPFSGKAEFAASPGSFDFGTVPAGAYANGSSSEQAVPAEIVLIKSPSAADAGLSITFRGNGPGNDPGGLGWEMNPNGDSQQVSCAATNTLARGSSCVLFVSYSPPANCASQGQRATASATFAISDGSGSAPFDITVTGTCQD